MLHSLFARGWRLATMSVLLLAGSGAYALAYSPVVAAQSAPAPKAYVGLFKDNSVAVLDTSSNQILSTIPVPTGPHGIVITPDGRWVYVSSDGASTVSVIDTNSDSVTNAVQVLDLATNQIVDQVATGASPHLPSFTPDGNLGLVVAQGPGELDLVDPEAYTTLGAVKVGTMPHWTATSADSSTAYVTNEESNDLSIVDLGSQTVTATIAVGNAPRKIAIQPNPSAPTAAAIGQ